MERIEGGKVALARHAKDVAHALDHQLINENFSGRPCPIIGSHERLQLLYVARISPSAKSGVEVPD
jgi:hypothetical protein